METMNKKTKRKEKKNKPKKVRTPEQKEARRLRRQQRRANNKALLSLKEKMNTVQTQATDTAYPWAPPVTSDGRPYSISVDNPDSVLGQIKKVKQLLAKEAEAKNKAEELEKKKRLQGQFAGHSGYGILYTQFD